MNCQWGKKQPYQKLNLTPYYFPHCVAYFLSYSSLSLYLLSIFGYYESCLPCTIQQLITPVLHLISQFISYN